MRFIYRIAVLCLLTMPVGVEAVPPEMVHEESLSGQELSGDQPLLSVGLARRLLAGGGAQLVLRVADEVLSRGGAPLAVADWLRIKAEALMLLEQFDTARTFLLEMPTDARSAYPDLTLLLATLERELGCCEAARSLYSDFLLAQPHHSKRFQAQLGIGLCALESGALEEAELQFNLYEQDPDRPKQDPLLLVGLAELARRKGLVQEENSRLAQLAQLAAPADPLTQRERLIVLASWEARQKHWSNGVAWVESGLRQQGALPRLLRLHTHLLRQWLAAGKEGSEVGGAAAVALPESVRQGAQRRMDGLRLLLQSGEKAPTEAQALAALEALLQQDREEGLGLLEEGGILRPDVLWPAGVPAPYRVAYADAALKRGEKDRAWQWLEGLTSGEAEGQRLLLLASHAGTEEESLVAVLDRLAKVATWSDGLKSRAVRALFLLTAQGKSVPMVRLRDLLVAALPHTRDVQRALAFHQAQLWSMEADASPVSVNRALLEFLSLAFPPHVKPEEDRYLPEDPRLVAIRLLEAQGWMAEAQALRLRR
ncbi:MAG: hypothetical protein HQL90_11620 [Magnetococcales bacterium]|nr:hypothetical protein [Magnetococcales bacterium]